MEYASDDSESWRLLCEEFCEPKTDIEETQLEDGVKNDISQHADGFFLGLVGITQAWDQFRAGRIGAAIVGILEIAISPSQTPIVQSECPA